MKRRLLPAGLLGFAALAAHSIASAAVAAPCVPAQMTPRAASVPQNLPGFGYSALKATAADVHLYAMPAHTELPLAVGPVEAGYLKVAPASPLTVGGSYQLEFTSFCDYGPTPKAGPVAFTVAAQAPLPTKIGTLQGSPAVATKDFGTTQFTIGAEYALDDEMKPWADVYELGLDVDGKTIETHPKLGAANASVQVSALGWCDGPIAATKNHKVKLRARLPFAPNLETTVSEVAFDCPAVAIKTPPPGNPTPGGGGGGTSGSGGGTTTTITNSGGCAVSTAASSSSSMLPAFASVLIAIAARRRKNTLAVRSPHRLTLR
jgi:hypothetical protein